MLTAIIGIVGVGIGALLTAALAVSREGRAQRLDALTSFVAANARVTVAHEGLFELISTEVLALRCPGKGILAGNAARSDDIILAARLIVVNDPRLFSFGALPNR